jgi:hypothetical protein
MLWAPLPLQAVAPNDVLRLASASTAPIARPARPQQRPQARRRTRLSTIAAIRVAVRGFPNRLRMSTAPSALAAATRVSIGTAVASANATSGRPASTVTLSGSIVGTPIGAQPRPGNGRESMVSRRDPHHTRFFARPTSEVPILRASKSASRATDQPLIVCAVGGGVETVNVIAPCTTEAA